MTNQSRSGGARSDAASHPLALLDLPLALLAGALWYTGASVGPWPLALVATGAVTRLRVSSRRRFAPSGIDLAVGLFALAAVLGLVVAYNPEVAADKFWVIIGGIAVYGAFRRAPAAVTLAGRTIKPATAFLAFVPAVIALFFIVTAPYAAMVGKLALLDPLYRGLASVQPQLGIDSLHPNVAGGLLAAFLPLQVAALRGSRLRYLLLPLSALGLLLSASRGAWLALALVGAAFLVLSVASRNRRRLAPAVAVALLICVASALVPVAQAQDMAAAGSLSGRAALLNDSAHLAWDYAFTGLGLGGFQMAFSSYILLVHVGHTFHSHNLFLNAWIEMGLPGLAAVLWLFGAGLIAALRVFRRGHSHARLWSAAALAAVFVIAAHGMGDDAFFGSRGALLMFIPFAVLARSEDAALRIGKLRHGSGLPPALFRGRAPLIAAIALTLALVAALLPSVRAHFMANLGALAQTRAELSVYSWPEWSIQDALRRSPDVELAPALARYRTALALDPHNATANRRLGQALLSQGEYNAAGPLLASAHQIDYTNRASRQLHGESLALDDRIEEAAAAWRTVDLGQGQIESRIWWYESLGEADNAAAIKAAAALAQNRE